jgi:uncharacterized glyoxalase superfamily protein PhnB
MPERSATALLGILQRHGVTREVLEFWVHVLESRTNGSVTFHHNDQGYLGKCDLRLAGQAVEMDSSLRLTNLLTSPILRQNCRSS